MTEHKKKLPAKRVAGSLTKAISAQIMDFQLVGVASNHARSNGKLLPLQVQTLHNVGIFCALTAGLDRPDTAAGAAAPA